MCTLINHNYQKLKRTKKDIYVITIKDIALTTKDILSVRYPFLWSLNKIAIDPFFNKKKINIECKQSPIVQKGMFHVSPLTNKMFTILKKDLRLWSSTAKVFLAIIPKNSYIFEGKNMACSMSLDDEKSILTNKLMLLQEINSVYALGKARKKYGITGDSCKC